MSEDKVQKVPGSVWKMALKQFSNSTAKSNPEITGGCVVTTVAALAMTLLIMSLEISLKKIKDTVQKSVLKERLGILKKIKKRLVQAADHDLEVFNQYRSLKVGSRKKEAEALKYKALIYAIKSPFKVASLIKESFPTLADSITFCHQSVFSDVEAGTLLLQSSFNAILALGQSNIKSLKREDLSLYDDLFAKLREEGRLKSEALMQSIQVHS